MHVFFFVRFVLIVVCYCLLFVLCVVVCDLPFVAGCMVVLCVRWCV